MHQLLCILTIQCKEKIVCKEKIENECKEKTENDLNQDTQNLLSCFRKNELVINLKNGKTETTLFGTTTRLKIAGKIDVLYNNQRINFTNTYKYLGNIVVHPLNFSENFEKSYKKASSRLRLLERMRCYLTSKAARLVYITMIIPLLTSSCTLKSPYNNTQKLKYNSLDKRAQKIIKLNVRSWSLLRLKFWSARGASHHPAFMGNCRTISHTFYSLIYPMDEENEDVGSV